MDNFRPRRRAVSPGSRRIATGVSGRSSTGTIPAYGSQYYSTYRPSADDYVSPRASGERISDDRRLLSDAYVTESPSTLRAPVDHFGTRRSTLDTGGRRPVITQNAAPSTRPKSVIHNTNEYAPNVATSPGLKNPNFDYDESYYLQPASSKGSRDHRRLASVDQYDRERLVPGTDRSRAGYKGYHQSGPLVRDPTNNEERGYRVRDPPPRAYIAGKVDPNDYTYTEPHDFWKEPGPRHRRHSAERGERPLNLGDYGRYGPRDSREAGPPVSYRGWAEPMQRSGSLGQSQKPVMRDEYRQNYRDPRDEGYYDDASRRPALHQKPAPYPIDRDPFPTEPKPKPRSSRGRDMDPDDYRRRYGDDEYDDRRRRSGSEDRYAFRGDEGAPYRGRDGRPHRQHDHNHNDRDLQRPRDESIDRKRGIASHGNTLPIPMAIPIRERSADPHRERSADEDRRRKRDEEEKEAHRERTDKDSRYKPRDGEPDRPREPERGMPERNDRHKTADETLESTRERERLEKHDRPRPRNTGSDPARDEHRRSTGDEPERGREPYEPESNRYKPRGDDLERPRSDADSEEHRRGRADRADDAGAQERRKSVVRVVSPPSKDAEAEKKPKGILRPPREKFPEEPEPVREGVAPLKDGAKKGIPANAKWTKISRKLVNPDALTEAHERFEERLDHVIVLRVLPKEEIEQLAKRTKEIRGKLLTPLPYD